MAFLGEGWRPPKSGQWQGGHVESRANEGGSDSAGNVQVVLFGNCPLGVGVVRSFENWYIT